MSLSRISHIPHITEGPVMFPERTLLRPTDLEFVEEEGSWDLVCGECDCKDHCGRSED